METFHVVGLALMFFLVLPDIDVVKGVMLTNCVCFIPGLLGRHDSKWSANDRETISFSSIRIMSLSCKIIFKNDFIFQYIIF